MLMVKKVKVSHSLIAVGAVGVRVPLYFGHSWGKAEPIPLLSLPYPSLIWKRNQFTARVDRDTFSSRHMSKPSLELTPKGDFLHHIQAALTAQLKLLSVFVVKPVIKQWLMQERVFTSYPNQHNFPRCCLWLSSLLCSFSFYFHSKADVRQSSRYIKDIEVITKTG